MLVILVKWYPSTKLHLHITRQIQKARIKAKTNQRLMKTRTWRAKARTRTNKWKWTSKKWRKNPVFWNASQFKKLK